MEFQSVSLTNLVVGEIFHADIPQVYYGQEQHFSGGAVPNDREALWLSGYPTTSTLYAWISSLNQIRNQAIYKDSGYVLYKAYPVYSDSSTIVMRKGDTGYQIIGVFTNLGVSGPSYTLALSSNETGFTESQSLVEVMSCTSYITDSSGNLAVAMAGGLPRIFYPTAQLTGSGICSEITG
jgi:alpha-amylase